MAPSLAPIRHVGLTTGLILTLVVNALAAPVLVLVGAALGRETPSVGIAAQALVYAPSVLAVVNVACVIALFKNRKGGFWGLCVTALLLVPILYPLGGGGASWLFGLVGVAGVGILYALLNTGDANTKAWPRLR